MEERMTIDTSALLLDLDERDINLWKNKRGWWWAYQKDLVTCVAPATSDQRSRSPALGPFDSQIAAALDAFAKTVALPT
jgi:hypothetical protein